MALLTDLNNLARKSILEPFDFSAFEREINELQEDFAALDAANGDYNIAFGSFSGGYTDEQVDEMNRLAELEFFEKNPISDEMVALLEQCVLEEDRSWCGPCFLAPIDQLVDLPPPDTMNVGDVIYVSETEESHIVIDSVGRKWVKFGGPVRYDPSALSEDFFIPADGRMTASLAELGIPGVGSGVLHPRQIPSTPKILASRTPSHEFLLEKRAENDLRRRNEGKKILSSRG